MRQPSPLPSAITRTLEGPSHHGAAQFITICNHSHTCCWPCSAWRKICQAWNEDLARLGGPVVPTTLRKRYVSYLLAYERHLSADCPFTMATNKSCALC